jgi:DNA invertase Pin-like site-specific DNA recombinase
MNGPEWLGDNANAIAILRVSSHRQRDGVSHETQEKEIRDYCVFNGLNLVRVERLIESAWDSDERKKFDAAMNGAFQDRIRHVLFYMYDRESRNLTHAERNEKLVKADIFVIHYVRDRKVLHRDSSDSDFFIRDVTAATNKHYSRNLSTKINDSMRQKAESGWYPSNRPPLGYTTRRLSDENGQELRHGTAYVVRDPDERKVKWVQMEFELRARGMSYETIRRLVIEAGYLSPKEIRQYRVGTIEYRIKNPFYEGYFLWKGKRYKGKHELIIPQKTVQLARENAGQRKLLKGPGDHGVFGKGWMRCAECECLITYDPKTKIYRSGKKTTFHYYRCSNGKKFHKSKVGMFVTEDVLWEQFGQVIDLISLPREAAQKIAQGLNIAHRKVAAAHLKRIDRLKEELESLTAREDRAYEDMLSALLDQDAFKRQRERIRAERARITNELEESKAALSGKTLESVSSIIELATTAKSIYLSRTAREKRDFLELVLSNPRLRGKTIEYDLRKHWGELVKMQGVSGMVVPSGHFSDLFPAFPSEENE